MGRGPLEWEGSAGPVTCWRPLLNHPPTEVTAALTGHCTPVVSSPPSSPGGGSHKAPLWDKGPEDPRGCRGARRPELVREGCSAEEAPAPAPGLLGPLRLSRGPGWGQHLPLRIPGDGESWRFPASSTTGSAPGVGPSWET